MRGSIGSVGALGNRSLLPRHAAKNRHLPDVVRLVEVQEVQRLAQRVLAALLLHGRLAEPRDPGPQTLLRAIVIGEDGVQGFRLGSVLDWPRATLVQDLIVIRPDWLLTQQVEETSSRRDDVAQDPVEAVPSNRRLDEAV